jgi:hypothetical protein
MKNEVNELGMSKSQIFSEKVCIVCFGLMTLLIGGFLLTKYIQSLLS